MAEIEVFSPDLSQAFWGNFYQNAIFGDDKSGDSPFLSFAIFGVFRRFLGQKGLFSLKKRIFNVKSILYEKNYIYILCVIHYQNREKLYI